MKNPMKTLRYVAVGLLVLNILLATPAVSGTTANILGFVQDFTDSMGAAVWTAYFQ